MGSMPGHWCMLVNSDPFMGGFCSIEHSMERSTTLVGTVSIDSKSLIFRDLQSSDHGSSGPICATRSKQPGNGQVNGRKPTRRSRKATRHSAQDDGARLDQLSKRKLLDGLRCARLVKLWRAHPTIGCRHMPREIRFDNQGRQPLRLLCGLAA